MPVTLDPEGGCVNPEGGQRLDVRQGGDGPFLEPACAGPDQPKWECPSCGAVYLHDLQVCPHDDAPLQLNVSDGWIG